MLQLVLKPISLVTRQTHLLLSNLSINSSGWINCKTSSHWPSSTSCLKQKQHEFRGHLGQQCKLVASRICRSDIQSDYLRKSMSSEYSPLMTPLSFSSASMLICSFLELRKSRMTLMISTSFTLMVSSAVMVTTGCQI